MGKLKIKNGTPVGSTHLCRNCTSGQFTVGYRQSDVLVICTNSSPARQITFPVYECTGFWDRNRPGYDEMNKLALDFSESRCKPIAGFRNNGFSQTPPVVEHEPGDEDDEAARKR